MPEKPIGKLSFDRCDVDHKSDIAVYVDVFLKDENDNIFKIRASSFIFDLEEVKVR